MITIQTKGGFQSTMNNLERMRRGDIFKTLDRYGQIGVDALSRATPSVTGKSAASWKYVILKNRRSYSIVWTNDNVAAGRPIVILVQYGHAAKDGSYIQGKDFINPAIRPVFEQMKNDVWREVKTRYGDTGR